MYKEKKGVFQFLRNIIHFGKILVMFLVMMLVLYWIQNLTGNFWAWAKFLNPFFDYLLEIGYYISSGSIDLFGAIFEYKFIIATFILLLFYALIHLCFMGVDVLEEGFNESSRFLKKAEENIYNKTLEVQAKSEQKSIKKYQVFVSVVAKAKLQKQGYNIDLEEQNKILLKHLIGKFGSSPTKFEDGYLFTFLNFSDIDNILNVLAKLPLSTAPVDFIMCVQIKDKNPQKEIENMKRMIELKVLNKIVTMADTVYRYDFNVVQKYSLSQLGIFQKDNDTFELFNFIEK